MQSTVSSPIGRYKITQTFLLIPYVGESIVKPQGLYCSFTHRSDHGDNHWKNLELHGGYVSPIHGEIVMILKRHCDSIYHYFVRQTLFTNNMMFVSKFSIKLNHIKDQQPCCTFEARYNEIGTRKSLVISGFILQLIL